MTLDYPGNWFWWVGSIARRSLITVRVVIHYALLQLVLLCYQNKNWDYMY
jgi:hypothetical protein